MLLHFISRRPAAPAGRRVATRAQRRYCCLVLALASAALALSVVVCKSSLAFALARRGGTAKVGRPAVRRAAGVRQGAWGDCEEHWGRDEEETSCGGSNELFGADKTNGALALETVQRWLKFLQGESSGRQIADGLLDASGYPLEQALELFVKELHRGASTVVTMKLPDGAPDILGPVGLVAAVRAGEDLDLSLLGGGEWETLHLDFLATNPLLTWASEMLSFDDALLDEMKRLRAVGGGGIGLLRQLLATAGRAGRAVTVSPLNEQLKEHYRRLGFQEDSFVDPTLMFWVPTEEVLEKLAAAAGGQQRMVAYGPR